MHEGRSVMASDKANEQGANSMTDDRSTVAKLSRLHRTCDTLFTRSFLPS